MARISYGPASNRAPASIGGGVAAGGDIFGAALEQLRLVDNSNAAAAALEDAYAARTRAVLEATGIDLGNPLFGEQRAFDPEQARLLAGDRFGAVLGGQAERVAAQRQAYADRLKALELQYPDKAAAIRAAEPVERDAEALARAADARLAGLMASNPGWSGYAWAFAGGAVGSLRDPLVVGSLAFGGGPGAARTVAARILTVAAKEALLNGGTTLAAQPMVQDWRRRAGLDHGFDQAVENVLFSAGLGGLFGAAGGGIGELAGGIGRRNAARARVEAFALAHPELGDAARRALTGDTSAAAAMLAEIRDVLPADVRGAIDVAEELAAREAERATELAHISARRHEDLANRAEVAARMRQMPDLIVEDRARINRLTRELAPRADSITDRLGVLGERPDFAATVADLRAGARMDEAARRPMAAFLKRLGGVDPGSPIAAELRAIGLDSRNAPGLFSRQGRKALDNIPLEELPDGLRVHAGADDGNGYVREQAFVDGLAAELEGRPWRDPNAAADDTVQNLDDYRRYLEANGVDFERMSDSEIVDQLAAIDDAERRFLAAEPNELGLSTDEVAFLPPGITRRAYTAEIVGEILRRLGDGVGDDVVKMAADTHIVAGETIEDAIDFALGQASGSRTLPAGDWADLPADLPADPPAPRTDAPIDPPEDDAIDWASLEAEGFTQIPFGERTLSLEALKKQIDDTAWLEKVVEACKL